MPLFYGPLKSPGLAAFLATTPADEGGQPQTAPPIQTPQDPLAQPPPASAPTTGRTSTTGGLTASDPALTMQVAYAQILAKKGRPPAQPGPQQAPFYPYSLSNALMR